MACEKGGQPKGVLRLVEVMKSHHAILDPETLSSVRDNTINPSSLPFIVVLTNTHHDCWV